MNGFIYIYENLINGKKYVGQTIDLTKRMYGHGYDKCTKLNLAFQKYGKENFELHVISNIPVHLLDYFERFLIDEFNTIKNGYNLESGGNKNKVMSEESKKKMSESKKKLYKDKSNHPRTGLYHSEKSKQIMSQRKLDNPTKYWDGKKRPNISGENHPLSKKIQCIETGEIFINSMEVENKYGYKNRSIRACCSGKIKSSYGFHWKYIP